MSAEPGTGRAGSATATGVPSGAAVRSGLEPRYRRLLGVLALAAWLVAATAGLLDATAFLAVGLLVAWAARGPARAAVTA